MSETRRVPVQVRSRTGTTHYVDWRRFAGQSPASVCGHLPNIHPWRRYPLEPFPSPKLATCRACLHSARIDPTRVRTATVPR